MESSIPNVHHVQPDMLRRCAQCRTLIPRSSEVIYQCPQCVGADVLCETCYLAHHGDCGIALSTFWFQYILIKPSKSRQGLLQCSTIAVRWYERPYYLHLSEDEFADAEKDHVILRDDREERISGRLRDVLDLLRRTQWRHVWVSSLCMGSEDDESAGAMRDLARIGACHRRRFDRPVRPELPEEVAPVGEQFDIHESFRGFARATEAIAMRMTPLELPPYQYRALADPNRSIRLLKLHRTGSDPSVEIITTDLESAPAYAALSYTWGTASRTTFIMCDGSAKIGITPNLASALQDLIALGYECMWIDAICINQQDLEEKSAQVSRMADIYRRAEGVVVHLLPKCGKDECHHLQAINLMEKFASVMKSGRRIKTNPHLIQEEFSKYGIPPPSDPAWDAWTELRLSPWFTRSWIVQEVTVNKNVLVLFHGVKIQFDELLLANTALELDIVFHTTQGTMNTRENLIAIDHIRRQQQTDPYSHSLQRIVELSSRFNAGDPRDKIFALLGLANDREKAPPPNYELPLEDVLYSFASFFCQQEPINCLHLLVAAGSRLRNSREGLQDLPSWVPTWTCPPSRLANQDIRTLAAMYKHFWNAGGFQFRDPIFEPDRKSLIVRAMPVGKIVATTSVFHNEGVPLEFERGFSRVDYPHFCQEAMDIIDRHPVAYRHPAEQVLIPTIEVGAGITTVSSLEKLSLIRKLSNREPLIDLSDSPLSATYERDLADRTTQYTSLLFPILEARRFAILSSGLMCLVEYPCLPGDMIFILEGIRVPFVLRPKGDGFEVICYCYVEGLMFGEALNACLWGGIRIR